MQGGYGGDYSLVYVFCIIGLLATMGLIIAVPIACWLYFGKAVGITILVFYIFIGGLFRFVRNFIKDSIN